MLPDMSHGNITVIGDVMLDRLERRQQTRQPRSAGAGSQCLRAGRSSRGAGNVAVNLAELGHSLAGGFVR